MSDIKESDWKVLRKIHKEALERFCKQTLSEVKRTNSDSTKSYHQRYLDLWAILRRRDEEMAQAFDDLRRSKAILQIAVIKRLGLFTENEFSQFSQETRDQVNLILLA
jgi:hypothetical protein